MVTPVRPPGVLYDEAILGIANQGKGMTSDDLGSVRDEHGLLCLFQIPAVVYIG